MINKDRNDLYILYIFAKIFFIRDLRKINHKIALVPKIPNVYNVHSLVS